MPTEGSVYLRKDGRYCAQYTDATGKARYLYRFLGGLAAFFADWQAHGVRLQESWGCWHLE